MSFLDRYCSTVQGLLDWLEIDLGFTELLFIQIDDICEAGTSLVQLPPDAPKKTQTKIEGPLFELAKKNIVHESGLFKTAFSMNIYICVQIQNDHVYIYIRMHIYTKIYAYAYL